MKKNLVYAMMSAIALTSAVSFTACSSDDAVVENNPTYDGSTVKTQFSISFPENVASTRMTSGTVQASEAIADFRGMSDIVLIPYLHATNRTKRLGNNITLAAGKMIKPEATNAANSIPNGKLIAKNNAVLFQDVTIPLGTSGFLFYGKATGDDGYANGYLTAEGLDNDNENTDISFSPTPIVSSIDKTKGEALAAYVTSIAQAKKDNTITWAACANNANAEATWYSEGLGQLYTKFTSMKAGASAYVQAAVQDLYSSIRNNTDDISKAIKTAIESTTYVESVSEGILTFKDNISNYPGGDNNFMPDGTAVLSWATSDGVKTATASTAGSEINVQDMEDIVYPASLYYFVNSGVKVANGPRKDEYEKAANDTWGKILDTYDGGTSVTASTRSVAITNPIQYAVGRLDVSVEALDGTKTYYDREGKAMEIPANAFTLNGVLIGGQKSVDWEFKQSGSEEYAIYDKTINTSSDPAISAVLSTATAIGPTYTLALETAKDQSVYVALEFVNNSGKDFQGFDGIVKDNSKFYMVAQLTPSNGTGYNSDSKNKVFMQDYKTIANFKIGVGSEDGDHDGVSDTPGGFANAYTTIPDLRTPQLELGFSVNLTWEEGITFTYTF